jgi:hypothetical protein
MYSFKIRGKILKIFFYIMFKSLKKESLFCCSFVNARLGKISRPPHNPHGWNSARIGLLSDDQIYPSLTWGSGGCKEQSRLGNLAIIQTKYPSHPPSTSSQPSMNALARAQTSNTPLILSSDTACHFMYIVH